jgi:3-methyladenine DNA glycosylase Mpg
MDILEAIRSHLPDEQAPESAWPPAFAALAALLLDRCTLHIAAIPHRLTEIELYHQGQRHIDPFAHGDQLQRRFGCWYFHRAGSEYRGGTFKGLDITFGSEDAAAGVLIRGVERMDAGSVLIDGPCLVVDHLLALHGAANIRELVARFDLSIAPTGGAPSPLYLTVRDAPLGKAIYRSPRVGLTLKRADTPDRRSFVARDYRFLSEPARIGKGRPHLIIGLHRQGFSEAHIVSITAASLSVVRRYVDAYERGRGEDAARFREAASAVEICALIGACDGRAARPSQP